MTEHTASSAWHQANLKYGEVQAELVSTVSGGKRIAVSIRVDRRNWDGSWQKVLIVEKRVRFTGDMSWRAAEEELVFPITPRRGDLDEGLLANMDEMPHFNEFLTRERFDAAVKHVGELMGFSRDSNAMMHRETRCVLLLNAVGVGVLR